MSSKMGDIWENYDINAEVGMESKDIVNIKIDRRVLLSAASDTKVEELETLEEEFRSELNDEDEILGNM